MYSVPAQPQLTTEPPPQLFVRSIGNAPGSYSVLTLNIHRTAQWDHDLMIDVRLFESLAIGDVIEVRKVEGRSFQAQSAAGANTQWRRGSFAYAYSDSDSEASEDESAFGVSLEHNHFGSSTHPQLFSPASQRTLLQNAEAPEDDENVLLLEVTTLSAPLGRVQISIKEKISKQFNFQLFSPVRVSKLSPATAARFEAAFVELSFSGRYLSNGDLWLVRSALKGKPVYVGKNIKVMGVTMNVEELHHLSPDGGVDERKTAKFGIVTKRTRFVFRSGSAQIYWLIQCSVEMWGFADDGDLMLERLFSRFIPNILDRWNACNAKHSLTVVLFTRTVFNGEPPVSSSSAIPLNRFPNPDDSRRYMDLYHVVISNETRSDWRTLLGPLQDAFHAFPKRANWASKVSPASMSRANSHVCGLPSIAQEGNILEAINLSLNVMQNQHVDRDLLRAGQLMVLMTAGSGVFEVDARLARLTKDRMTNHAVGCDIISLTQPPSHVVPLFIHNPSPSFPSSTQREFYEFDQAHLFFDSKARHRRDNSWSGGSQDGSISASPPTFSSAGSFASQFRGYDSSPKEKPANTTKSPNPFSHSSHHRPSKIPLFNIPYWLNLAFPFHLPTKEFQPVFEHRMFAIPDPQRSSFPSALLAPLERVSMKSSMDLELSTPVATWATNRRVPSRNETRPWFPLVDDLLAGALSPSPGNAAVQPAPTPREVTAIETKRISSPSVKRSSTTANLHRSASLAQVSAPANPMLRSQSTSTPFPPQSAFPVAPTINASLASSSLPVGNAGSQQQQQQQQQQQPQQQQQRLLPSPSLVALQSFTGLGLDRTAAQNVPKVSWIQDASGFALPPASSSSTQGGSLKARTVSMSAGMDRQYGTALHSLSTATTTSSALPTPTNQSLAHFQGSVADVNALRAKQKRHDAQVFSPPHVQHQQALQQKKRVNALPVMSPSGMLSAPSSLPMKQSVNDLATLAMTPSMNQKARVIAQSSSSLAISRSRRGASETDTQLGVSQSSSFGGSTSSAGGLLLPKPLRLERSSSLNIPTRFQSNLMKEEEDDETRSEGERMVRREEAEEEDDEEPLPEAELSPMSRESSSSSSYSSFNVPPLPPPSSLPIAMPTVSSTLGTTASVASQASSTASAYPPSQFVNPFQLDSLMKWYCERPSHSRSRWLHLFPNSRLDGLRYMDLDAEEGEEEMPDVYGVPGMGTRGRRDTMLTTTLAGIAEESEMTMGETRDNPSPSIAHVPSAPDVLLIAEEDGQHIPSQQQQSVNVGDVNWKSLQTPAILPLTTGFAPTSDSLAQSYSIGTYSLVGTNMDQVLLDVICQRLAEDFQIYDPEDFQEHVGALSPRAGSGTGADAFSSPSLTSASSRIPFVSGGNGNGGRAGGLDKENYILTIGHRVHVLSYSRSLKKLDITLFGREQHHHHSSMATSTSETNTQSKEQTKTEPASSAIPKSGVSSSLGSIEYRYMLWDSHFAEARPIARNFLDDSGAEYSWNYVDNLLMGEESIEFQPPSAEFLVRFKSIKFRLFDAASVRRLLEVVGEKLQQAGHFSSPSLSAAGQGGGGAFASFVRFIGESEGHNRKETQESVRSVLDHQIRLGPTFELDFEVPGGGKSATATMSEEAGDVPEKRTGANVRSSSLRDREWMYLNVDNQFHPDRAFHFELRWIVASGDSVFKFVEDCLGRVNEALEPPARRMIQVASYCASFSQHPFVAPVRVVFHRSTTPSAVENEGAASQLLRECCDNLITRTKLFVLDSKEEEKLGMSRPSTGRDQPSQQQPLPRNIKSVILVRASETQSPLAGSAFCRLTTVKGESMPITEQVVAAEFLCNPFVLPASDLPGLIEQVKSELMAHCHVKVMTEI